MNVIQTKKVIEEKENSRQGPFLIHFFVLFSEFNFAVCIVHKIRFTILTIIINAYISKNHIIKS